MQYFSRVMLVAAFFCLGPAYVGTVAASGVTPIYDIQGAGHISPVVDTTVQTEGIVTAVDSNGFYLQDPGGDGDDATSDGIFVFTSSPPAVSIGDSISVTGSVTEFIPGGASTNNLSITEIVSPVITPVSTGNPLPAPVVLGFAGRLPPTEIIDNDNFAVFDPAEDGIDFYETVEGMRVMIDDAVAVAPKNRFNEIFTVTDNGAFATGINPRGGITITATDFNPERIQVQIDTDLAPDPGIDIDQGDSLGDVVGVVSYSFGNFEVKATEMFTPVSAGLTEETTSLTGDSTRLTVATFNLLNLDPNPGDGDDDIGDGRFAAVASQIVDNMQAPDIVGLQEIQDNNGSVDDGVVDADVTYQTLIAAIATAGGPVYDYVDYPPVNNADGGQPGGNIRNGYIYRPDRVSLVTSFRVLDPNLADGDAFLNSRKPVYAEFDLQGTPAHLVNVHFTSKGGSSPLFGAVQPPINGNADRRQAQAQVVNDFVDGLLAAGDNKVAVIGDVNAFSFETAMQILKGAPAPVLTDLTETLPTLDQYTFIFRGNSQALDHFLISDELLATGPEYDIVHANVEFEDQANDHEASVMRLTVVTDADGDGVSDSTDNCTDVANPDQYDSNGDNIGSLCDADINGIGGVEDCVVNFLDLNAMKDAFFSNPASPSWNPDADLDNSGIVSFADLQIVKAQFFGPPGPSAAGCN